MRSKESQASARHRTNDASDLGPGCSLSSRHPFAGNKRRERTGNVVVATAAVHLIVAAPPLTASLPSLPLTVSSAVSTRGGHGGVRGA